MASQELHRDEDHREAPSGVIEGPFTIYKTVPDMARGQPMVDTPEERSYAVCRMGTAGLPFQFVPDPDGHLVGVADQHYLLVAYDIQAKHWCCQALVRKETQASPTCGHLHQHLAF